MSGRKIHLPSAIMWVLVVIFGLTAICGIALNRGETISSLWILVAAVCIYTLAYRFYSAFIATKVLLLDQNRATPAERFNDGRDFMPTHLQMVVFGHHFAAIAGPGPLIGPTLAYTVWVFARDAVDFDRFGVRWLCAGFSHSVFFCS